MHPVSRPAVLIVSAANGTGHIRAADAVHEAFTARDPGVHVEHVELLSIAPRWVRTFYGSLFETMVARAPRLWKEIYRVTDGDEQNHARWGPVAHRTLFREFRRLLKSGPWRVCVCTHFLPAQLAAGRFGLPPLALVITDFGLHRFWVQRGVAQYFVATDTMQHDLRRRRVRRTRIEVTGIPIGPAFAHAPSCAEARTELGLAHDRPVALVTGGGLGIGVEEATAAALQATHPAAQIVAICARNEAAQARLSALGIPRERLHVYGTVCGMERFLAAADVVAGKPGGLTVSEAMAVGRPLLLTRPIPGAEEVNTRAVVQEGAGLGASTPAEMRDAFHRVFAEPGLLERLSAEALRIGRPHAARDIAAAIERDYLPRTDA
jgi:processive 1,2-diacylglycerol beta-glucosyltransferase